MLAGVGVSTAGMNADAHAGQAFDELVLLKRGGKLIYNGPTGAALLVASRSRCQSHAIWTTLLQQSALAPCQSSLTCSMICGEDPADCPRPRA